MLLTPSFRKDRARVIRNLSRHKARRPGLAIETLEGREMLAAHVVAFDMLGSADQNLVSFTNPFDGAFASAADGFQKYQRGVSPSIPFAVLDDSLSIFGPDELGIIKEGNTDEFFGVADTENPQNSGPVSATWVFDISGSTDLLLSIDMGAMGNFEVSNDFFEWSYSIDGGSTMTAFASSVDEAASFTYTLDDGDDFTLDDPMLVQGTILSNELATYSTPIVGSGSELTLTLTAMSNGSDEGIAFQSIVLREAPSVAPVDFEVSQGKIGLNGLSNSKGKSNGVVPIVLFTTDTFDASTVDVSTVIWAGAGVYHSSLEDVDNDGDLDLVMHFRLKDTDLLAVFAGLADKNGSHKKQSFNVSTTLSGETTDGTQFLGTAPVDVFMSGRALRDLLDIDC